MFVVSGVRDRLNALRHKLDVRAQIAEHPWHAIAAAALFGAWFATGDDTTPRRIGVRTLLFDLALAIAHEALSHPVTRPLPS